MHFSQTTVALALVAAVAAVPMPNGGSSAPSATCSSGSNYCFQQGKMTKSQSQSCTTGDAYCCNGGSSDSRREVERRGVSGGTGGLLGDGTLNCANVANGLALSVPVTLSRKRNEAPAPSSTCSTGSNYCYQSGKMTKKQSQDCTSGDAYCCDSGSDGFANCLNLLNNAAITIPITVGSVSLKEKRNSGGEQSAPSSTCDSGTNYCVQDGKWTKKQSQSCSTGSSYCCSGSGTLDCVNALNGASITIPITLTL